jgi:hypothetical protein
LLAIRESADLIASSKFVPIIAPVCESLGGLEKALSALTDAGAEAVVVVNPRYGDHKQSGDDIAAFLKRDYSGNYAVHAGILLTSEMSANQAFDQIVRYSTWGITLIHSGFTDSRTLAGKIEEYAPLFRNVFLDAHTNLLYRRHFSGKPRILVGDGFVPMKNADYQLVDTFSDLHVTYSERGMDGYGEDAVDTSTVGACSLNGSQNVGVGVAFDPVDRPNVTGRSVIELMGRFNRSGWCVDHTVRVGPGMGSHPAHTQPHPTTPSNAKSQLMHRGKGADLVLEKGSCFG